MLRAHDRTPLFEVANGPPAVLFEVLQTCRESPA